MKLVIQLESIDTLMKYEYPNDEEMLEDLLVNEEMLVDTYEDGCEIGYGYSSISTLEKEEKNQEIQNILTTLEAFGCIVDFKEETIVFTKEFCDKYIQLRLSILKEKISNLSLEEYSKYSFEIDITKFEENIPLGDINVVSESLHICKETILNLCRMNFNPYNEKFNTKVNETPFKIIEMFVGY